MIAASRLQVTLLTIAALVVIPFAITQVRAAFRREE